MNNNDEGYYGGGVGMQDVSPNFDDWESQRQQNEEPVDISLRVVLFDWKKLEKALARGKSDSAAKTTDIMHYFKFLIFIILNNAFMSFWSMIGWAIHARKTNPMLNADGTAGTSRPNNQITDLLFISSFQPSSDDAWVAMVILGTLTMFATAPIFYMMAPLYGWSDEETLEHSIEEQKVGKENLSTQNSSAVRMLTSYSIFLVLCCVPAGINYALLFTANYQSLQGTYETFAGVNPKVGPQGQGLFGAGLATVVSITSTVSSLIFEAIVGNLLSSIEQHPRGSTVHRLHRLAKLCIFRLCNVMSLFIIRYYADSPFFDCISFRIGSQIFIFILLDLSINNMVELICAIWPIIWVRICTRHNVEAEDLEKSYREKIEDAKPESEITDDYFEVLYRQYVLMFSFSVFPGISFFCFVANLVEYVADVYRFLHFDKIPTQNFNASRKFVALLIVLSSVAGLVHFPSGPIWFSPQIGPILCWPCEAYTQTVLSTGGVCHPAFEASTCLDRDGNIVAQDVIQSKIDQIVAAPSRDSAAYVQAKQWFDSNDHLFHSRRCNCRPCNLALSCPCGKPPLQRYDAPKTITANLSAPRSNFSYQGWKASNQNVSSYCGGASVNPECWQCPEFNTNWLVDPVVMRDKWPKIYFCDRCSTFGCICNGNCPSFN